MSSVEGEGTSGAAELAAMRRRFIEALRRAEIIALVNAADDEASLAREVTEELCEAYDAEIAVLAELAPGEPARVVAAVGLKAEETGSLISAPESTEAMESDVPLAAKEVESLGFGIRAAIYAGHTGRSGRRLLMIVARVYEQPFDAAEAALMEAVTVSAGLALDRMWADGERQRLVEDLKSSLIGTAEALANALEAKDYYTAGHAREIADLAVEVGKRLGLTGRALEDLRFGGTLHDIGKIAIPEVILNKPGPLEPKEREVMEQHSIIGEEILAPVPFLEGVRPIVRHNHERWDGSGYPDGLVGEEIPIAARIVSAVDSFHAMTSNRTYHDAIPAAEALAELRRNAGTQFDPKVVDAVVEVLSERT